MHRKAHRRSDPTRVPGVVAFNTGTDQEYSSAEFEVITGGKSFFTIGMESYSKLWLGFAGYRFPKHAYPKLQLMQIPASRAGTLKISR